MYLNRYSSDVLYTKSELKKLHSNFGYPSAKVLRNLIKKSNLKKFDQSVIQEYEKITRRCTQCRIYASRISRFRISFPMDEILFSHEIEVDLMWIYSGPVLRIIDRGILYSVTRFAENESAEHIWEIL